MHVFINIHLFGGRVANVGAVITADSWRFVTIFLMNCYQATKYMTYLVAVRYVGVYPVRLAPLTGMIFDNWAKEPKKDDSCVPFNSHPTPISESLLSIPIGHWKSYPSSAQGMFELICFPAQTFTTSYCISAQNKYLADSKHFFNSLWFVFSFVASRYAMQVIMYPFRIDAKNSINTMTIKGI